LADNIRDAAKKGRVQRGEKHWANRHREWMCRGERHHLAKLTEEAVREIRAVWNVMATGKELAREFGVQEMAISTIVNHQKWRHVRNEP